MAAVPSAGRVLRTTLFLTVLGFLTFVLIGPVVAVVLGVLALVLGLMAVTLPFALVGLLVWGIYVAASPDRRVAWRRLRGHVAAVGRWVVAVPLTVCGRVCAWGVAVGRGLAPKAVPVARRAGEAARDAAQAGAVLAGRGAEAAAALATRSRSVAQIVGNVILEIVGGAAVGMILVCLADSAGSRATMGWHILGGALAGAALGLLVGAARSSPKPERG